MRHGTITTHVADASQHEMMVSWHETTILRLETIISWHNTMIFVEGIVLSISGLWTLLLSTHIRVEPLQ